MEDQALPLDILLRVSDYRPPSGLAVEFLDGDA